MSVSRRDLMRYYDGDLSAERAREVERTLEADEAAAEHLRALRQLGDSARVWAEERSAAERDLVDAVMRRIAEDDRARRRAFRFAVGRVAPVAAALLAAAAAAVLLVTLRQPGASPPVARSGTAAVIAASASNEAGGKEPLPVGGAAGPPAPAVAIEAVDFGESHGSIFVLSSERGDTPVVWLSDGPAISAPRTHPL